MILTSAAIELPVAGIKDQVLDIYLSEVRLLANLGEPLVLDGTVLGFPDGVTPFWRQTGGTAVELEQQSFDAVIYPVEEGQYRLVRPAGAVEAAVSLPPPRTARRWPGK